jgi:hypothetical protein
MQIESLIISTYQVAVDSQIYSFLRMAYIYAFLFKGWTELYKFLLEWMLCFEFYADILM